MVHTERNCGQYCKANVLALAFDAGREGESWKDGSWLP
jgi:hypothetical protein